METSPVYVIDGQDDPPAYHCKECGSWMGAICRRQHNGKWITYLARWGDRIYHGDIQCTYCHNLETWSMNQTSFDALMSNYEQKTET